MTKGFEKAGDQARKMENAIKDGSAQALDGINPKGDIYGQLTQSLQKHVAQYSDGVLEFGRFDKATNTLNATLTHTNGTVEHLKASMYGLNGECAVQQTGVGKLTSSWDRFKSSISQTGKQLMTALVGYNVFFKAISEVRKGIGYVKEIDLALTELKKVTDETEESYRKFLNTAGSTAGEIGSTVSDFTEATANFARLNI
jgi:ABC-type transporter Mla subunit MlaD